MILEDLVGGSQSSGAYPTVSLDSEANLFPNDSFGNSAEL